MPDFARKRLADVHGFELLLRVFTSVECSVDCLRKGESSGKDKDEEGENLHSGDADTDSAMDSKVPLMGLIEMAQSYPVRSSLRLY